MTFDPCAPSVAEFIESLPPDDEFFPLFSFSEVSLDEVHSAISLFCRPGVMMAFHKVLFLLHFPSWDRSLEGYLMIH